MVLCVFPLYLSLPLTCVASSLRVLWPLSHGLAVSETACFIIPEDLRNRKAADQLYSKSEYGNRSHESSLLVLSDFRYIIYGEAFLYNTFLIIKTWPVIEIAAGRSQSNTHLRVSKGNSGTSKSFYYRYTAWEKMVPPP